MSTLNFNMIEKLYKNLPYVAREMINVLAIYGDPMRLEDMMRVLNLLKVKPSGKKRMTISSMEQPLTRLSRVGFIESEMLLYFTSKITPMLDVINYIAIKLEGEKKIEQYYAALVGAGLMIDILSLKRFSDKYKKHIQEKHHIYFRFLVLYNQYNRMLVIYKNISIKTEFDVIVTIYLDMFVKVSGGGHDWVYTREEPFVVCYILNKIPYMVSECKVLDQPLKKIDTLSSIDLAKLLSLPYANYIYIMIKYIHNLFKRKFMRALLSVSDKTGIVDFAKELVDLGFEIISTGGTKRTLQENGINAIDISEITKFPECFGGRVKTLNPYVHGGILYRSQVDDEEAKKLGIERIDLVAVNLYPFKETIKRTDDFDEIIEIIRELEKEINHLDMSS